MAVHAIDGGVAFACFGAVDGNAAALGDGIADWHAALTPPRAASFWFRDGGFATAAARANLAATLRQRIGKASIARLASL
ncbi:hypothetical protein [Sphingomonas sp. CFBP 13720]|uniref:hypothetical protein n=1 Tax=Sphingomonas sp. CFBP 13720 TaxID=2775302 RepID=UPI00177D5868|nr:hypothetical protein [Sphingomonas sp. CFBP 13720]MBD8677995.1 hypothetical protein [Sphingomonas sp. CFBP 13720]